MCSLTVIVSQAISSGSSQSFAVMGGGGRCAISDEGVTLGISSVSEARRYKSSGGSSADFNQEAVT